MRTYYDETIGDTIVSAGTPEWTVTSVVPCRDYTLLLTFVGGERKLFDAKELLNRQIYSPLREPEFFMRAKAEGATVVWSDEIDIAPEYLYEKSVPV